MRKGETDGRRRRLLMSSESHHSLTLKAPWMNEKLISELGLDTCRSLSAQTAQSREAPCCRRVHVVGGLRFQRIERPSAPTQLDHNTLFGVLSCSARLLQISRPTFALAECQPSFVDDCTEFHSNVHICSSLPKNIPRKIFGRGNLPLRF